MSNYYITEAFKQLNLLESEDIAMDASGVEELRSFLDDAAVDPDEEIEIYDLEAEAKEDLKKSYEGKVVLECTVCHSHVFEDKENISVGEDGEVCMDLECPYCMSNEGYYIIGEIAPYNPEKAEELQADEEDLPEVDIEDAADEIDEDDFEDLDESMKLDGVEELYDNDEIRGVEELEGVDELEGVEALHGDKHEDPINEGCEDKLNEDIPDVEHIEYISGNIYETQDGGKLKFIKKITDEDGELIYKFKPLDEESIAIAKEIAKDNEEEFDGFSYLTDEEVFYTFEDPLYEACSKKLNEASEFKPYKNKSLKESIEDVSVTTEDETMTMTTKEDGGVVIETMPKEDVEGETFETEDEMIVPIEDETSETIDVASDALDSEDELEFDEVKDEMTSDEELSDEEFVDELEDEESVDDFEEFDEESFDNLGESYLKNCYENVTSFKTSNVSANNDKLFIEGLITFDSGNKKKTNFVFEAVKKEDGKYKFEGYNQQISRGKKTFKLNGVANNNKLVCESLNYNYRSKNDLNESVRVYGTVRKK